MAFPTDSTHIPRFTYASALEHYENAKHYTKMRSEERQLGHKRRPQLIIVKTYDNDIQLILHCTACVTLHPNGTRTFRTGGWDTPTTSRFINRQIACGSFRGSLYVSTNLGNVIIGNSITLDAEGNYISGGVQFSEQVLDKAKCAQLRAKWALVVKYAKGLSCITELPKEDTHYVDWSEAPSADKFHKYVEAIGASRWAPISLSFEEWKKRLYERLYNGNNGYVVKEYPLGVLPKR